jgi:hypothetical protein
VDNRDDANVLEDFYDLMRFDGLVRSESNYTIMASRLHHYRMEIVPTNCTSIDGGDPDPHVTSIRFRLDEDIAGVAKSEERTI